MTFTFAVQEGEPLTLAEAVGQAVGAASVCWEDMTGTGVFDEARAREIAAALETFVQGLVIRAGQREQRTGMIRYEVAVDTGRGHVSFHVLATDFTTAGADGSRVTTFWQETRELTADTGAQVEVRVPAFQAPAGRIIWIRDVDAQQADVAQLGLATTQEMLEELAARGEVGQVTDLHGTAQRLLEELAPVVLRYRTAGDDY